MTTWSKHPPRQPGLYNFRGVRQSYRQQNLALDELVQVRWTTIGKAKKLGVAMFGKARIYHLENFIGQWSALEAGAEHVR